MLNINQRLHMDTVKNMTSTAVSAFANNSAATDAVDKAFNAPGLAKQMSDFAQSKLQRAPVVVAPVAPNAEDKWSLPLKVIGVIGAIAALYFFINSQTKVGLKHLSAEEKDPELQHKSKVIGWYAVVIGIVVTLISIRYLPILDPVRSWFAKFWLAGMFKSSPTKSRGTLSSRRSYYPPRSCRYQLKTK